MSLALPSVLFYWLIRLCTDAGGCSYAAAPSGQKRRALAQGIAWPLGAVGCWLFTHNVDYGFFSVSMPSIRDREKSHNTTLC